jgi:hypothetical protein
MDNRVPNNYHLDRQLWPLVSSVAQALETRGIVATLSLWQPVPALALLPFSLHARWPDRVDRLPLSTTMTLLPCSGADRALLEVPLCTPEEAYTARVCARWYRNEMKTAHDGDFRLVDWEEGYHRHRKDGGQRLLGANSYLAVDTVRPEGTIARGSRPYLGRFASRRAYRPSLLIPGRGALSEAALAVLASTDLAVFNLQRLRGTRTRDVLKGVLAARRRLSLPTLLVASSPNDLFALEDEEIEHAVPLYTTEYTPTLEQLHLAPVGRDRLQLEQHFHFAVTELRGYSAALDTALDEIELAWWIARQSLDPSSARAAVLPRLAHAEQYLSSVAPADAGLLHSAHELIERALADEACMQERLEQVLTCCEEHFKIPAYTKTVVLVRGGQEGECLRQAMNARWNTSDAELLSLGLEVKSTWSEPQPCDQLIGSSYLGSRTLDMIFWSGARQATLLLDAVEARAAAFHVARMHKLLRRSPATQALGVLTTIVPAFEAMTARTPETLVHIPLATFLQKPTSEQVSSLEIQPGAASSRNQVLVTFTNGTTLLCAPTQLFDLLEAEGAGRLLQRAAADLEPGDELLIIEQETHAHFSVRLMQLLDETLLQAEHASRNAWLIIVSSTAQGRSRKQVYNGLRERGIRVDYGTVRSWVPQIDDIEKGTVPNHWHTFKALADELQITLPEETLRTYYQAARTWRVQHRTFGRILTRLMRHAAFGRLDSETLRNVEKQWGWGVRDLLQATRRCTVDDLVRIAADTPLHLAG